MRPLLGPLEVRVEAARWPTVCPPWCPLSSEKDISESVPICVFGNGKSKKRDMGTKSTKQKKQKYI